MSDERRTPRTPARGRRRQSPANRTLPLFVSPNTYASGPASRGRRALGVQPPAPRRPGPSPRVVDFGASPDRTLAYNSPSLGQGGGPSPVPPPGSPAAASASPWVPPGQVPRVPAGRSPGSEKGEASSSEASSSGDDSDEKDEHGSPTPWQPSGTPATAAGLYAKIQRNAGSWSSYENLVPFVRIRDPERATSNLIVAAVEYAKATGKRVRDVLPENLGPHDVGVFGALLAGREALVFGDDSE